MTEREVTQRLVLVKSAPFYVINLGVNRGQNTPLRVVANNTHNTRMTPQALKKAKVAEPQTIRHKNQVEGEKQKSRVDVYMSADLKAQLKELARKNRRSVSLYMNEVIRPILEQAIRDEIRKK